MNCPVCESQQVHVSRINLEAAAIGLPSGVLAGVEQIQCDECGEESISVPSQGAVMKEYRKQLAQLARHLRPDEFAFLRRQLGVTGRGYAQALGVSNVTISRVENGDEVPAVQEANVRGLTLLDLVTNAAMDQLRERRADEVTIDVQAVERGRAREISFGWQPLPTSAIPLGSVTALHPRATSARIVDCVEFEASSRRAQVAMCH